MFLHKYGPFAQIVLIASALLATFSVLLLKMMGRLSQWTFLVADSPSFIVTAGARFVALILMASVYATINENNYLFFAAAAIVCGFVGLFFILRFNKARILYTVKIPLVGRHG